MGRKGKSIPKETNAIITRDKWSQKRTTHESLAQMFTKGEKDALLSKTPLSRLKVNQGLQRKGLNEISTSFPALKGAQLMNKGLWLHNPNQGKDTTHNPV